MKSVKPFATITLTLFNDNDRETGLLIESAGDLPRDPAERTRLLGEVADSLRRYAETRRRLPRRAE